VLLAIYVLSSIEPSISFGDVTDWLSVENTKRYGQLAALGLVITAIVAVAKVLRSRDDSEGANRR